MKKMIQIFFIFLNFLNSKSYAWPIFIDTFLIEDFYDLPTEKIIGISCNGNTFFRVPIQIEERNNSYKITLYNPDFVNKSYKSFYPNKEQKIGLNSVLFFDERLLGTCNLHNKEEIINSLKKFCQINRKKIYKIEITPTEKNIFILSCKENLKKFKPAVPIDLEKNTLSSSQIIYQYNPQNTMIMENFSIYDPTSSSFQTLLSSSELHLYAKPKSFFPLHFDKSNIKSEIIAYKQGEVATIGELSFSLHVLFFKIKLNLVSQVIMFRDAIYIPVTLTLPVSGDMLHSGSGIFYGFQFHGENFLKNIQTTIPFLPPPHQSIPFQEKHTFYLQSKNVFAGVVINSPSYFSHMNFSPTLATSQELATWNFPKVSSHFGIFYDITKLQKGIHHLSAWFYFGNKDDSKIIKEIINGSFSFTIEQHEIP